MADDGDMLHHDRRSSTRVASHAPREHVLRETPRATTGDAATIAMHDRQRELFRASLHAALTLEEVRAMVAPLGIPNDAVRMTSDRHWTIRHVKAW
jgi:hypothetical protein